MQYYIRNNLALKATQMHEDFELVGENGSKFLGKSGDYIVEENGFHYGCPKVVVENTLTKENRASVRRKEMHFKMMQGFAEMANINLEIANEMAHIEDEADNTINSNLTTY